MEAKQILLYVFVGLLSCASAIHSADCDSDLEKEYGLMQAKLVKLLQDAPKERPLAVRVAITNYHKVVNDLDYSGKRLFSPLQAAICLDAVKRALLVCKKL